MRIVIEDNQKLKFDLLMDIEETMLYKRFRVKDPKSFYSKAMKKGNWDGFYNYYKIGSHILNKGYLPEIIKLCQEHNFPYDIIDKRPKYPLPAPDSFDEYLIDGVKALPHQLRCWKSVCNNNTINEIGTHWHPTGSGKSIMMAGIVKLFKCPTLIITEHTIVLQQLTNCLKLYNVVHHNDIGEFYSGKMPNGNLVCIGSISSLQFPKKPIYAKFKIKYSTLKKEFDKLYNSDKELLSSIITDTGVLAWRTSDILEKDSNNEKAINISKTINFEQELKLAITRFEKYVKNKIFQTSLKAYYTITEKYSELCKMVSEANLLIVDEMDNASSDLYKPLFEKLYTGRFIYGFSGTPYDDSKPVEKIILKGRFGSIISSSKRKEVEKLGQIQPIKYYMIQFGENDPKDKTAFDIAEKNIIINNDKFHDLIIKMINSFSNEKHLIILDTLNIEDIGKTLNKKIENSSFIYGKTSARNRRKAISEFEEGKSKILIVTKIGKRGMDIKGGTHNMFIIGGGKLQSNFDQIIGRSVRKNDKGFTRVYDFYFTNNHYLLNHSRKRLNYLVNMGYNAYIIHKNKLIKAENFIKSKYKL